MAVNIATLKLIRDFEGERLDVYKDAAGLPTVGVGHLVKPGESYVLGQRISRQESERLLRDDLKMTEDAVRRLVTVKLNENQYGALVSLTFNIGAGNLKKSTLLRRVNQGQFLDAANGFLAWNKARVRGVLTVLRGLTRRRQAERELFLTPMS